MMMKNKYLRRIVFVMAGIVLGFSSCDDPFKNNVFRVYDEVPVATWLAKRPEFSLWVEVLKKIDKEGAFNVSTQKMTCFVVANDALNAYAKAQNSSYNSILDMPTDELLKLVQHHTLPDYVIRSKNMIGKIPRITASNDYLTAVYDIDANKRYISNGDDKAPSYIIENDIEVINGYINVLDRPIETIFQSVWDVIRDTPKYSTFADAIAATDTLERFLDNEDAVLWVGPTDGAKNDYPYKDRKTVFVVPNEVYESFNIYSYEDLKREKFPNDDPTDLTTEFGEYLLYHIMHKYMSYEDLTTFPYMAKKGNQPGPGYLKSMILYSMSSRSGIGVIDQGDIVFNDHDPNSRFNIVKRDIPASNGYLHEINSMLEIPASMPRYNVEVEFTDRIEFTAISYYREEIANGASPREFRIYLGNIPGMTWEAVPLESAKVWYSNVFMPMSGNDKVNRYKNYDALYWDLGSTGMFTFKLPPTPKGKWGLYCEKSNDKYVGGRYGVFWGLNNMGDNRNFMGGDEVSTWGQANFDDEVSRNLSFRITYAPGAAGVDRVFILPE